jgi:DNA repair exonuclease SbcCD ATPase subunit
MFDLGNIISLIIMLIILVVYRILDKDNRSLDKIRKYSEKLRNDLAAYADSRAEDLKSYAIDLDVHQKAAREILKRVQSVEDALSTRGEIMGTMGARIAEYDKALAELKDMSARVDENLAIIHDESAFVSNVVKTLKQAKNEVSRLSADIPDIEARIAAEARGIMENTQRAMHAEIDAAMGAVHSEIATLADRADDSISTVQSMHAEAARAAESQFRVIEAELGKAFDKAREEGEILEEAALRKLQDQIEARGTKLSEAIESRFQALREQAKAKVVETQGLLKTFKADWRKDADAMLAEIKADLVDAAERMTARLTEVETHTASAEHLYEERYQKVEAKVKENAQLVQARIKEHLKSYQDDMADRQADIRNTIKEGIAATKAEAEAAVKTLSELVQDFMNRGQHLAAEQHANMDKLAAGLAADMENLNDKFTNQTVALERRVISHFETRTKDVKNLVEQGLQRINASSLDMDRMEAALGDAMLAVERRIEDSFSGFATAMVERQTSFADDIEDRQKNYIKTFSDIQTAFITDATARQDAVAQELNGKQESMASQLAAKQAAHIQELNGRQETLANDLTGKQAAWAQELDKRQSGYENTLGQRQEAFAASLSEQHTALSAALVQDTSTLRDAVQILEKELNSLKAKAYADVSGKLQIFEDEFFDDLRDRSKAIEARLAEWRIEMEDHLSSAVRESDSIRADQDKAWLDEAKARLADTQGRIAEQIEKIAEQVDAHRQAISERIAEAADALTNLKASVKADLDDARSAAKAFMHAELDRFKHDSGERIREAERNAMAEALRLEEAALAARHRYESAKAALEAEAQTYKDSCSTLLQHTEAEQQAAIKCLEQAYAKETAAILDDWDKEKRKVIETAKSEREALTRDVRGLSDEIGRFRQELTQKTAQAMDDFNRMHERLASETDLKTQETMRTMNEALDAWRHETRTIKDRFEASRSQLAAALDDEKKIRERSFGDMDKQIKAFQTQTKLFERADDLKRSLGDAMEAMKADMARAESRRSEMAELETQYMRIKRLEDELAQKIARFLAEKRRIDTMEEDFKRLLSLSQAVDQKLATVTASSDQLSQIQANIRKLGEEADMAAEKYERLEKKSNLLDTTADAVDKNFQAITELERNIRTIDADIRDVPDHIIDMKRSLDEVMAFKPKLDATIARLDEVDSSMASTEKRAVELNKAREWLARAETRFDELNKKTQEHLRMLNDILKDEPAGNRKDKGAPSLSVQETVRKLSHQGWKVEEIARAVKLSRGEVELILELGGKD